MALLGILTGKLCLTRGLAIKSRSQRQLVPQIKTCIKRYASRNVALTRPTKSLSTTIQWTIAGCGVLTVRCLFDHKTAKCEVHVQAPASVKDETTSAAFPWLQFFGTLWPHVMALTIAIVTALAVAILNTNIGVTIGKLVNVLSAHLPAVGAQESSGQSFMEQVRGPAYQIVKLYASHAAMTFAYIYSLSIVGK
jgi:hypothetical protein